MEGCIGAGEGAPRADDLTEPGPVETASPQAEPRRSGDRREVRERRARCAPGRNTGFGGVRKPGGGTG